MSLLTGLRSTPRSRAAAAAPDPAARPAPDAALVAAQADIARLTGELATARAGESGARAEAQAANTRAGGLQERLDARSGAIADLERDLAAARATVEGLQGQIATERAAREAMKAPLEQAIAAAAKAPVIVHPQQSEPVAYEVVVAGRDMNSRMEKLVLKPMKAT